LNLGNGGNTGIVPVANGGTGASSAATALSNLGVTSSGYLSTALLTSGLIPGGDLVSGSVTSTQLNSIVAAGTYNTIVVGADGRITSGTYTPIAAYQVNDGRGDFALLARIYPPDCAVPGRCHERRLWGMKTSSRRAS
jgi:hypothetical protein